ncbi:MAG: hypothetical protein ACPIOQ_52575 [Promethearchaeia archaeon]
MPTGIPLGKEAASTWMKTAPKIMLPFTMPISSGNRSGWATRITFQAPCVICQLIQTDPDLI